MSLGGRPRQNTNNCPVCGAEKTISDTMCVECGFSKVWQSENLFKEGQSSQQKNIIFNPDSEGVYGNIGATLDKGDPEPLSNFTDEQVAHIKSTIKRILKIKILELLKTRDCTISEMRKALGEREELIMACVAELLEADEIQSNRSRAEYDTRLHRSYQAEYGLKPKTAEERFMEGQSSQQKDLSLYPDDEPENTPEEKEPPETNPILRRMREISL